MIQRIRRPGPKGDIRQDVEHGPGKVGALKARPGGWYASGPPRLTTPAKQMHRVNCPDCLSTEYRSINSRRFKPRRLRGQNAIARAWKCCRCGALFVTKEEVMYPTDDAIDEISHTQVRATLGNAHRVKGGLHLSDPALRWLEEHDPDFDTIEEGRVSNSHGIITQQGANRIPRHESPYSQHANDNQAHCGACSRKSKAHRDPA